MADAYTQEEIQEISEAYHEALRTGTPVSKELATAMKDASIGVKGASAEIVKGLTQLGRSVTDYGSAMYKGEQGMKAFNKSITDVEDAVDTFANIIIAAIAVFNPLAAAGIFLTKTLIKGGLEYTKAVGEMSDKIYDAYHDLSRAGAAGQQGMSAVYTSMQKFGYGIDELDKMSAIVRENSKNLALFSGTVLDGTNRLADTANSIQRSGLQTEFLKMGMSVDDINRGIAGYYGQLGRLGQLQGKSQADLNAGTVAYLKEMEGLTRLTGQQRQDMEKQREEANQVDQFLAQVQNLGKAGDEAYKAFNIISSASPAAAKAMASSFSGFITDESSQLFQLTGGALGQLNEQLRTGQITGEQYAKSIGEAVKGTGKFQEGLALIPGAFRDTFGVYQESLNLQQLATKDFSKAIGQTKPMDGLTQSAVELRQKQMASRDALQDFVKLGVGPATDALNTLAGAAKSATNSLPGAGNKENQGGGRSGGWLRDLLGLPAPGASTATSSSAGLEGVNADLATAVQKATAEYQSVTGKSATITSGVRDYEKQKKLYDDWIAGGKKGNPVAAPGTSRHETGMAVDINSEAANYMDQAGILKKYGLTRPVAGDAPHVELAGARSNNAPSADLTGAKSGYNQTITANPSSDISATDRYDQMANNTFTSDSKMDALIDQVTNLVSINQSQLTVNQNQLNVQEKTYQVQA